jgi:origin recognition complex subunit 2
MCNSLKVLVAHPKISLVAIIDRIRVPLLCDAARVSQFNFFWHDGTTFEPYTVVIAADEILSLVDGAGRAEGNKGVHCEIYSCIAGEYNARQLFRIGWVFFYQHIMFLGCNC